MSFRLFDFECTTCGTFEEMVANDEHKLPCPVCKGDAERLIAAPRIDWKKMGLDPGFPSAYEKWGNAQTQHHKSGIDDSRSGANLKMY